MVKKEVKKKAAKKKVVKKKVIVPDYEGYSKFLGVTDTIDKTLDLQMKYVEEGCKKFNLTKTEGYKILQDKIRTNNAFKRSEKQKLAGEELEKKREERRALKEDTDAEKEASKILKKQLLDELELNWKTCDDDLFVNVFEDDWRKGVHYFAKRLMSERRYITFEDSEELIVYDSKEGIYVMNAKAFVAEEAEKRLGEKAVIHNVFEVVEKIKRITKKPRSILYEQPEHLKPVANGLLNIKTGKLEDFSPDFIFINKINIPFIDTADCPNFKKFLKNVTSDGNKNPIDNNAKVLKQWFGYCLLNDCRYEKALLFYGLGGNGKSIICKVLKKFLGEKNVVSIPLQYLESNNFAASRFFGKTANIFTDLPKTALKQTSKFKIIVSGDPITIERKGKDSYEAAITTKQIYSCNEVPRTPDTTNAFFDRLIILKFLHDYRNSPERIERYEETFYEELPGILNFAIEGLNDLLENGFVENMNRSEVVDFWLRHSDSIAAFNMDMIEKDLDSEEFKQDVYDTYENYCQIKGYSPDAQNAFFRRFKEVCEIDEYMPKGDDGEIRRRKFKGIKLKALPTESNRGTDNE